jgi:hypothetical protein
MRHPYQSWHPQEHQYFLPDSRRHQTGGNRRHQVLRKTIDSLFGGLFAATEDEQRNYRADCDYHHDN